MMIAEQPKRKTATQAVSSISLVRLLTQPEGVMSFQDERAHRITHSMGFLWHPTREIVYLGPAYGARVCFGDDLAL
jgi:hypothetical protein